jgi:hypothetical protein
LTASAAIWSNKLERHQYVPKITWTGLGRKLLDTIPGHAA